MSITFNTPNLTRTAKINILAQELVQLTNAPTVEIDEWVNQSIRSLDWPVSSIEFKEQLMTDMPAMNTVEGLRRKAQRIIAALKEAGTIVAKGKGSLTEYHLME